MQVSSCAKFWPQLNEFTFCVKAKKAIGEFGCVLGLASPGALRRTGRGLEEAPQAILELAGDSSVGVGSETHQAAMNDPGSSAGDSPSSIEDPRSLPSSGTQASTDGTGRAEDNAGVPNVPDCSGIPQGCEGKDNEGTLVEKAALVEKPPHDPEEGECDESQFLELYPL
ncbi:hypothetical protein ACRRTK_001798 [Alexandromys fortis]